MAGRPKDASIPFTAPVGASIADQMKPMISELITYG